MVVRTGSGVACNTWAGWGGERFGEGVFGILIFLIGGAKSAAISWWGGLRFFT